jgi:rhamnogalacturonan endolyase
MGVTFNSSESEGFMSCSFAKSTVAMLMGLLLFGGCQTTRAPQTAAVPQEPKPTGPAVTVIEDQTSFTLSNGTVTARVLKSSGDIRSLQYKGIETLTDKTGHGGGYWSQDTAGGASLVTKVTIDPASNNGDRAEVSIKGISGSINMGHGGENPAGGAFPADIEIRYNIGRGESGVYTYYIWDHLPDYPAGALPESRFVTKLTDIFDWTGVDDARTMIEVPQATIGHRYTFATTQFDHRAYGWVSSKQNIGYWFVNPSAEYLSGGPTKAEFLAHRDTNAIGAPCVLNYWKASHFGGANVTVAQGEHWTKVIGPFLIYCNSGADPIAIWKDAQAQASRESAKWPYDWVKGVDYTGRGERATVKGQIVLSDPLMPSAKMSKLLVGLSAPAYAPPAIAPRGRGRGATTGPSASQTRGSRGPAAGAALIVAGRLIDWQHDAKYYEFWEHGEDNGQFSIPNVRAGKYTLHAIADGVLGEYAMADITVEAGKPIDLGKLTWTPVRRGKQIWEIGIPNRNAKEFTYGDKFFDSDSELLYPKMFPDDVNFVIGKSDTHKDWFYEQLPHATDDNVRFAPAAGVSGSGRATPYNIRFEMAAAPKGKATLRLAICGTGARTLEVSVNDKPAGQVNLIGTDGVIVRHGGQGIWYEREVAFDASLMKQGENVLTLTVPAGPINNGVLYDYLRLELDETAQAASAR